MNTMANPPPSPRLGRELIFALVAPLGVDRPMVEDALHTALCSAGYGLISIEVSKQIERFSPHHTDPNIPLYLSRKKILMDAGDSMRQKWSERSGTPRGDAAALAAITEMRRHRTEINTRKEAPEDADRLASTPLPNTAFLLTSLKHPDELSLLKRIYGPAFVSIGVYTPHETRRKLLIRESGAKSGNLQIIAHIEELMIRDQTGGNEQHFELPLGQNVGKAFDKTDFILDATKQKHEVISQLTRLVHLVFGDVYITPSKDEFGLFLARAGQARSGSLARQVGAAILREDGSVISVSMNEVPRPLSGGPYSAEDDYRYKGRDMAYRPKDSSDEFREEMLGDLLELLDKAGVLSDAHSIHRSGIDEEKKSEMREKRMQNLYFAKDAPLRKARLRDNIDYIRAVHAEAHSIIDAARHGVSVKGAIMFTTTFPCHECARHIVASGIKEVVYLSPYLKSGVKELYADSIEVDPQIPSGEKVIFRTFVGVSPARYLEFFTPERDRKDGHGKTLDFNLRNEAPHLPYYTPTAEAVATREALELLPFHAWLKEVDSTLPAEQDSQAEFSNEPKGARDAG